MLLRVLVCTVAGAACGALAGGLVVALTIVTSEPIDGSNFFGMSRWEWALLGFLMGAVPGGLAGLVTGLSVALVEAGRSSALFIGTIVGVVAAATLFGVGAASEPPWAVWAILSPPACALVGLAASALASKLSR